jgi:hypothetical protein
MAAVQTGALAPGPDHQQQQQLRHVQFLIKNAHTGLWLLRIFFFSKELYFLSVPINYIQYT